MQSTILFTAVFGTNCGDPVCADNGADGNIIVNETLRRISAAGMKMSVEELSQPRVFEMAASNADGGTS